MVLHFWGRRDGCVCIRVKDYSTTLMNTLVRPAIAAQLLSDVQGNGHLGIASVAEVPIHNKADSPWPAKEQGSPISTPSDRSRDYSFMAATYVHTGVGDAR
jgi:hypothetical protein